MQVQFKRMEINWKKIKNSKNFIDFSKFEMRSEKNKGIRNNLMKCLRIQNKFIKLREGLS